MANERDCENCKHHKETCRNGMFIHSCESWECEFERKPMTKAEAKELLLNIAAYDKRSDKWIEQEVVAEAVNALEQTEGDLDSSSSSEKPNKWIPVSERMPEKDKYTDFYKCMVARTYTSRSNTCDICIAYFDGKRFLSHNSHGIVSGVKAWMPLPEPYKAEGSEKE